MDAELIARVLGNLQIGSLLGRGSMARVCQARQVPLRRPAAQRIHSAAGVAAQAHAILRTFEGR